MANYKYTIRRMHELSDPTAERPLAETMESLLNKLRHTSSAPDRLEYNNNLGQRWPSHGEAVHRLREIMKHDNGPDRVVVRTQLGADYAIRKFKVRKKPPVQNGEGTEQIDRIKPAVLVFCRDKGWPVTDMGTCVDKPGEHGHCNAWDGGCLHEQGGGPLPSDEIHRRNLEVAKFLRSEGVKYQNGNGGLPVNGVITLSQYWERGMGGESWNFYNGTYHAAHWHVSGWPSRTGWV